MLDCDLLTGDPLKPLGYSFRAVASTTGVMHLSHWRGGRALCGRVPGEEWTEVGAKAWYTNGLERRTTTGRTRKCMECEARCGPWATIKLVRVAA